MKVPQLVDLQARDHEWSGKAHPTHPPAREKREANEENPGILGTLAFWYKSADIPTFMTHEVGEAHNMQYKEGRQNENVKGTGKRKHQQQ